MVSIRPPAYSYRKFFKHPLKIYSIGRGNKSLVFSKGIEIRQLLVAILFFGFLFLFRRSINHLLPTTLQLAFYGVLPWMAAGALCRSRLDGKRLDRFFSGYVRFLSSRRTRYSSGKPVCRSQTNRKQSYERFQ